MADEKAKKGKKGEKGQKAPKQASPEGKEGKAKEAAKPRREQKPHTPSPFEQKYRDEVAPALTKQFSYTNRMEVPKLEKVVINTSIKDALTDIKVLETACNEIAQITIQTRNARSDLVSSTSLMTRSPSSSV